MRELASLLQGKTLLVMGDSVMEQFYNVLQCWLRKEVRSKIALQCRALYRMRRIFLCTLTRRKQLYNVLQSGALTLPTYPRQGSPPR